MNEEIEHDLDYDKLFRVVVIAQKFSGCHPDVKRDKFWALHFFLMHGVLTVNCCLFIYNIPHDLKVGNYSQMCSNMCLSFVYVVVSLMYFNMLVYQKKLRSLMEMMKTEYTAADALPEEERKVILDYGLQGRWLSRVWGILVVCGMMQFFLKCFVTTINSAVQGRFKIAQFYEVVLPEAIEPYNDNPVFFCLLYFTLFFFSLYISALYASVIPLGPIFLLHGCARLENIRKKIEDLFNHDDHVVREHLKDIIIQLQDIYCYTDDINECFQILYEFLLKATALVLPVTVFAVIQVTIDVVRNYFPSGILGSLANYDAIRTVNAFGRHEFLPEFFAFIFGAFMIGATPCYYSNMLMEKSEEVRMALYSCGWEGRYDRRTRTSIILMLLRALQPVAVRTIFRSVSLTTLTDVLQQSYTLFNLLNAMWN